MNLLQKILLPVLGVLLIAITILSVFIYAITDNSVNQIRTDELNSNVENIENLLKKSDAVSEEAMRIFNEKSIALVKSFAEYIADVPSSINEASMKRIADLYNLSEVHVINKDGILYAGNVPEYYGYDMASSPQSAVFLEILKDPSLVIAQDPEPNGANGELFQYIGVATRDKTELVQIGIAADTIQQIRDSLDISSSVSTARIGDSGFMMLIENNVITAHRDNSMVGRDISSESFYGTISSNSGSSWIEIDSEKYYASYKNVNGKIIVALLTRGEYYSLLDSVRNTAIGFIIVSSIAMAIILFYILKRTIAPLHTLSEGLGKVAQGDLNVLFATNSRDEIGQLCGSTQQVVDVFQKLIKSFTEMSNEIDRGEIDARICTDDFEGSYKLIAQGFNKSIGDLIDDIIKYMDCLDRLGSGDFNADMPKLPGKKVIMNTKLDELRENLKFVSKQINDLSEEALKGNLNARTDVKSAKGDWANILNMLNRLMQTVEEPNQEIAEVMEKVANGNFNSKLTGDYQGEFLQIKNSVNNTITNIASYIDEISTVLGRVADNDLSLDISRNYVGSFSNIKDALNNIITNFNSVLSDINAAADQVSVGAQQISNTSNNLSAGAIRQDDSVKELNSMLEAINLDTASNAENANNAKALSDSSQENAAKGSKDMSSMLASMDGIKSSSANISKVIKVIDDIAFQTNLLALNAAVEAARAGDHGKGFAVVAEEVRNLAARSQKSVMETSALIEASTSCVNDGTKIADITSSALSTIVGDAEKIAGIIAGIAESSGKQADSILLVSDGLAKISTIVSENSSISLETASAAQELSSQADVLKGLVGVFKLKS